MQIFKVFDRAAIANAWAARSCIHASESIPAMIRIGVRPIRGLPPFRWMNQIGVSLCGGRDACVDDFPYNSDVCDRI